MTTTSKLTAFEAREKVRNMNLQINSQLKRAGILDSKGRIAKTLDSLPESEWKTWIQDVISVRDFLIIEFNIQ